MKQITKSYLEYLGITDISADGKVFTKKGELKPILAGRSKNNPCKQQKFAIRLHDPKKYKNVPKEKRTSNSGTVRLYVHQIVYAWFKGEIPYGKELHHKDFNCLNNSIDNLEALTHEEHVSKHASTREMKCRLDRPREYYEKKVAEYEAKGSTSAGHYRAKLRYYDNHIDEARQAQKDKRDLEMIKELAKQAKNDSDSCRWHQLNQIIKDWKSYDSDLKEQLIQVILKGHTFNV